MGWLMGSLVACCTASLVAGSDGALSKPQMDARTSNTYNTNERFPILLRRGLPFRNDTGISEKLIYAARTSTVPTDSAVVTSTQTELSSTPTLKEHSFPSKLLNPEYLSDTLLEPNINMPSTSSALGSSGVVPHSTTEPSIALPIISASKIASTHTWQFEHVNLDISGFASSINPSRTASSLAVTPDPRPSLSDSVVSTSLQDVVSSETVVAQLPKITSALVYSLSVILPTNPLSTAYSETQQQGNQSTASIVILSPSATQHANLLGSESIFEPSSTAVVSGKQTQHVDALAETPSAFSNFGTALSILSDASKTAAGLQEHLVSSLSNWAPLVSSTADLNRSSGTQVPTVTATTLARTIPQQTALASEVVENFFTSITPVPKNTSAVLSEETAANAPWLSLVFTRANSQTTILSPPVLSAKPAISTTSGLYSNSSFSGVVPTANQTAIPQSVTSSTLGPYTTPLQGDSLSLPPGIYPTSAPGNDSVSGRARSHSSFQMTQTGAQPASILAPFAPTSLMLTSSQTSKTTLTVEIADVQHVSSSIYLSTSSLPCSSISTPFIVWTNTSTSTPIKESTASSQPTISTKLGANSSAPPLVLWYIARTSSVSSTSTPPPVSKYMEFSSFVTRTRTSASEPALQTILVANDVNKTVSTSSITTLLPMHSPTETVATTSPPPLTTSETAGVAIASTAGLLLAIVAAVFLARRYHAARSAKHGSDRSSFAYPQLAYLYDPSLGCAESDNGGDDEAPTFMSGGATGRPLSPTSTTPPPPPHNSVDFGYRRLYSSDSPYSDPGNPFADVEDPFLEWRSSDAISTPSDARSALAAAIERYSNGPQKPLPPLPGSISTHAFRDHIIPSPTLSPITNGRGLQRSHARSSSRSSVQSQRSLRKFHCSSSSTSGSRDYGRATRHSLTSIHETDSHHRASDLMGHDLLLPVDTRSETPDSVVVYASTLTPKSLTQYPIPTPFANNPVSMSSGEGTPHSNPPFNHPTQPPPHPSGPSPINATITDISYTDFPSPPNATCTPTHKGWDEIKRMSTDYTILMSPLSPLSPSSFSPAFPAPPPPLKKRSLINLAQKTRLSGTAPVSSRAHRSAPAPLRIKTRFEEGERKGVEAKRKSLVDKVQSLGEHERGEVERRGWWL